MSKCVSRKIESHSENFMKDLIVLVADKNSHDGINALLSKRQQALGISITYDIKTHSGRDPGCYLYSADFLYLHRADYRYTIVIFDYEGCGNKTDGAVEIEKKVEHLLSAKGWNERSAVIVVNPEIDIWLWRDSPHVSEALGWKNQPIDMKQWLLEKGFLKEISQVKPERPKEALEAVLQKIKKPRSSSIYKEIAEKVSVNGCQDRAFNKFLETLRLWFER